MMEKKRWFTGCRMTWKTVVVLALASAVLTAVLALIPALEDTSFQDIAVNPECWLLFAVFIVVNCDKWYEAALKTFVFFLISQPLIYLIQVPFVDIGFGLFRYYAFWFRMTILTLPGAAVAFLVKRRDWPGAAALAVATGGLGYMAAYYSVSVRASFPHHLLSMIFCAALALFLILTLFDRRCHRLALIGVLIISLAVSLVLLSPEQTVTVELGEGNWTVSSYDTSVVDVAAEDGGTFLLTAGSGGNTFITFENDRGETMEFLVTVSGGTIYVYPFE